MRLTFKNIILKNNFCQEILIEYLKKSINHRRLALLKKGQEYFLIEKELEIKS